MDNRNKWWYRTLGRVMETLEAIYWLIRQRFTFKQVIKIARGKSHIVYRDLDSDLAEHGYGGWDR